VGAKEVCQDILKLHECYDFVEGQSVEFILEPHFQYDASHTPVPDLFLSAFYEEIDGPFCSNLKLDGFYQGHSK